MSATAPVRVAGRQGTPAWLDNRRDVVGSSDIPVITGSSPFRSTSLFHLWAVKTRQVEEQQPSADDDTEERREDEERFWFGHALEPVIADRYSLVTGRRLRRSNDQLRHPVHGWVGASLDREVIGERRIVEVKWVPRGGWARDTADPVPAHVLDQVQWQMLVRGWGVADVAVLDGDRLRVVEVAADPGYQDDLLFLAHEKLWRHVLSGDMPPTDGSDATRRALDSIANRRRLVNGVHLDARSDEVLTRMATELHEAQRAEKKAEATASTIKAAIRSLLIAAEASGADGEGWRIDWHRNKDSERVTTDHVAIAALYRRLLEQALEVGDTTVRGAIRDAGFDPDAPDLLDVIEGLHTTTETKEGARRLRLYWKDEETGKWQ
jgi:putative phage-type endonuclease